MGRVKPPQTGGEPLSPVEPLKPAEPRNGVCARHPPAPHTHKEIARHCMQWGMLTVACVRVNDLVWENFHDPADGEMAARR